MTMCALLIAQIPRSNLCGRQSRQVFFALLTTCLLNGTLMAQTPSTHYPARAVRWVVPFASGGGTDVISRPIALSIGELLGQPMVYDNRGGGNGMIAGELVAKSAPDGYTLLVGSPAVVTTNQSLYAKMPFNALTDFTPITRFANVPNLLGAHPLLPVHSVRELIDYAKAHPKQVNWASSGIGSGGHLGIELFQSRAGIKVEHIAYKGAGPALVGVISGNAQLLLAGPGVFLPHMKAGRIKPLAIGSLQRIPILPELPTLNESGLSGMETGSWYGLLAPRGTPKSVIRVLHEATVKVLQQPSTLTRLVNDGALVAGNTPEQFAQDIRREEAQWSRIIKAAHIQLD